MDTDKNKKGERNMENLKVMLCCGAGMSSGFLASNARKVAKKQKLAVSIEARSQSEVAGYLSSIDVLLLGPALRSGSGQVSGSGEAVWGGCSRDTPGCVWSVGRRADSGDCYGTGKTKVRAKTAILALKRNQKLRKTSFCLLYPIRRKCAR